MVNHQIKVLQAVASAIAEGGRGVARYQLFTRPHVKKEREREREREREDTRDDRHAVAKFSE